MTGDLNSKYQQSIEFAQQAFTRNKNGIYYSDQLSFDQFDILNDTRETMKFDIVVAIEIIEHIYDYKKFLEVIVKKFARKIKDGQYDTQEPTEFFISTPNRNNKNIRKDKPYNSYHCREWTS